MNWSLCHIALGYNYHMMNIIQQVTDPMPTNLSYIVSTKLLLLSSMLHLLQNTAITVTVTVTIVVVTTIKTIILLCY